MFHSEKIIESIGEVIPVREFLPSLRAPNPKNSFPTFLLRQIENQIVIEFGDL